MPHPRTRRNSASLILAAALLLAPGIVAAPGGNGRVPSFLELLAVMQAAEANHVSAFRILLIGYTESKLELPRRDPGPAGERGLFQVTERTAAPKSKGGVGCLPGWDKRSRVIEFPAADCAAKVLADAKPECQRDIRKAVYAYNMGNCENYTENTHVQRALWWVDQMWIQGINEVRITRR